MSGWIVISPCRSYVGEAILTIVRQQHGPEVVGQEICACRCQRPAGVDASSFAQEIVSDLLGRQDVVLLARESDAKDLGIELV